MAITYPIAYKRWTPDMDKELIALLSSPTTLEEIVMVTGRSPGSIRSRTMVLRDRGELVMLPSGSI
jgi:hypothetical protein